MSRKQIGSLFKKTPDAARWTGTYVDPFDKKRKAVTLFTDKRASRVKLDELIGLVERKLSGLVDRHIEQRQRPIKEHVAEYLEHCRHVQESAVHIGNKKTQLERAVRSIGAARVTDLEPNKVAEYLQELSTSGRAKVHRSGKDNGLSARSVNQHRATIIAFLEWCVRNDRLSANPLKILPKLDEARDRRHVRRAYTESELERLIASPAGRGKLYHFAVLTGLRRNELAGIAWSDVDFNAACIRVRPNIGKSKREAVVPLNVQAIEILRALKLQDAKSSDAIFQTLPTNPTFQRDLKRAKIDRIDEAGRILDFHALRTTTGTLLARAGVAPQIVSRVMRHSDMKITLKHYTDLRISDDAQAVAKLPAFGAPKSSAPSAAVATGTYGNCDPVSNPTSDPTGDPIRLFDADQRHHPDSNPTSTLTFNDTLNPTLNDTQKPKLSRGTGAAQEKRSKRDLGGHRDGRGSEHRSDESVGAPQVARNAPNPALGDFGLHNGGGAADRLRLVGRSVQPAQAPVNTAVGASVRQGARRGRDEMPKLIPVPKTRAIGAVG